MRCFIKYEDGIIDDQDDVIIIIIKYIMSRNLYKSKDNIGILMTKINETTNDVIFSLK